MSDDDDKKLISIFADSRVWVGIDVLYKLLDSENLEGKPGVYVRVALKETLKYIEEQTIVSISDKMFDSLGEE